MSEANRRGRARGLLIAWALAVGCSISSPVSRELGARCDSAAECEDRCLPPGAAFPGGFCSTSCEDNGDCPVESRCTATEAGVCLFACGADNECQFLGEGWRCADVSLREDATRMVKVCLGG